MFEEPRESAHLCSSVIIIITRKRLYPDSIRDLIRIRIAVAHSIRDSIRTKISDSQAHYCIVSRQINYLSPSTTTTTTTATAAAAIVWHTRHCALSERLLVRPASAMTFCRDVVRTSMLRP